MISLLELGCIPSRLRQVACRDNLNSFKPAKSSVMPRVYVGNLASSVTSGDLIEHFSRAGEVRGALAVTDRISGLCRGFGFVEMAALSDIAVAFSMLNNTLLNGQPIKIEPEPSLKIGAKPGTHFQN
jgi:RNA recognition motif-containing protein